MQDTTARSLQSWTLSACIHGLALGTAMILLPDMPKPAQREPFVWTVSLVEPPPAPTQTPTVHPASPPSQAKAAQSTPAQARPTEVTPVVRTVQPVQQVQQPVHQVVQQEVKAERPATQQIAQAAQVSPQITETQRVQPAREIVQQEATEASPLVQEAGPITQQTQQVVSQASSPVSTNRQEVSVETQSTPAAQSVGTIQSVAATQHVQKGVRNRLPERPEGCCAQTVPDPFPPAALYAQSASRSAIETEPVSEAVAERSVVATAARARTPVTELPVRAMPGTKADYGWLARELWNRVERLKRYPRLARVHGWEGKVVVRAVIKADGSLLQEDVEESSGHEALDQDALDLMKQVCPLALKHALGQSQVVVHVPIHYRIEQ